MVSPTSADTAAKMTRSHGAGRVSGFAFAWSVAPSDTHTGTTNGRLVLANRYILREDGGGNEETGGMDQKTNQMRDGRGAANE